jgi:tetratricopeptide (TPR) repeat protein
VFLGMLMGPMLLAACATPYGQGQSALREGRYDEAARHFEEALARDPDRLASLVGLGVARYKDGQLDEAIGELSRAVERDPNDQTARLYLGLAYLRRGEDGRAEEHLTSFRDLGLAPRLSSQLDRTLNVLGPDTPLTDEMRVFVAASLEDAAESARELREALARPLYPPYPLAYRNCFVSRRHRIVCF